jgi:hypothetical protein
LDDKVEVPLVVNHYGRELSGDLLSPSASSVIKSAATASPMCSERNRAEYPPETRLERVAQSLRLEERKEIGAEYADPEE